MQEKPVLYKPMKRNVMEVLHTQGHKRILKHKSFFCRAIYSLFVNV